MFMDDIYKNAAIITVGIILVIFIYRSLVYQSTLFEGLKVKGYDGETSSPEEISTETTNAAIDSEESLNLSVNRKYLEKTLVAGYKDYGNRLLQLIMVSPGLNEENTDELYKKCKIYHKQMKIHEKALDVLDNM